MRKSKGNAALIIIVILAVLLAVAIAFGAYFWGKSKSATQTTKTASPNASITKSSTSSATPTPTAATSNQAEETPKQVVENFMNYTLGTLPGAQINYEKARAYLTDNMQAQYSGENWVPAFYGIQDGPTSVKFISENSSGESVTLRYDPSWGEMSLGWTFILDQDGNKWYINGFRNDSQ